jgi:hypothetical protein
MIIGSTAIKNWFPEFREPNDLDVWMPFVGDDEIDGKRVDSFWHDSFPAEWADNFMATPDMLATIKASHSYWDIHGTWNKHMGDYFFLLKKGAKVDWDLHDFLRPIWRELHGAKRTSLAKNKMEFFGDAVNRKYDHDSVHDSVAYGDIPMYTLILADGEEVMVDNSKFWAMSQEDRLKTIREEIYATALERWVIPTNYTISPRLAYARAVRLSMTSLFKGKWAKYILENIEELNKPDMDYVARHKSQMHKLIPLEEN